MKFNLIKKLNSGVRVGQIQTKHGVIHTPFFMPVGTVGSVKGISPQELKDLGAEIVLANTYHLYLRPGQKNIKKLGGLHKFMNWNGPILTDSGGYQVFSLAKNNLKPQTSNLKPTTQNLKLSEIPNKLKSYSLIPNQKSLVKVTNEGAEFTSHLDGSKHFFTPEKVIQIQLDLGVDILMPLDYCPSGTASGKEIERAVKITIDWAKRSKKYFDQKITNHLSTSLEAGKTQNTNKLPHRQSPERRFQISNIKFQTNSKIKISKLTDSHCEESATRQSSNEAMKQCNNEKRSALFGIIQGGLDIELRKYCAKEIEKLNFDGYAVGGLAVDFETRDMWRVVKLMGEILPADKPRYLMGVGTPDDIYQAIHLGMDMFDCVLPTRLARHGSVYAKSQITNCLIGNRRRGDLKSKPQNIKTNNVTMKQSSNRYTMINLLNSKYRTDGSVIDQNCTCPACAGGFSKAYISHLIREHEMLGMRLATLHNLHQYLELTRRVK